jgi:hypothetical protein
MSSYHQKKISVSIQEYIKSGIVEGYALGLASPDEAAQFERLLLSHLELREALSDFEGQLELFAFQHSVPPPPGIREKIEGRIRELPAVKPKYRLEERSSEKEKDPPPEYIPIRDTSPHIRVHKYWRPAFIVLFILSKIFLILFLYYYFQNRYAQKEIRLLEKQEKVTGSTTAPGK